MNIHSTAFAGIEEIRYRKMGPRNESVGHNRRGQRNMSLGNCCMTLLVLVKAFLVLLSRKSISKKYRNEWTKNDITFPSLITTITLSGH